MTGRLVIMGSGETAPTMVEVHRSAARAGRAGPALLLDTPYGFQENAEDITRRAVQYFGRHVQRRLTPLRWRTALDGVELDNALAAVRSAGSVFAGPGSPTYALRVWRGSGIADALVAAVRGGATVTFGSAAALTLGGCAVPVYEIYKCGVDPFWTPGLDVLGELTGLRAAVIPHYDNTDGGTHSTRFCYLGERRLRLLEAELADGAHVIGVDEHTALELDLAAGTATVLGRGGVTVRVEGDSRIVRSGRVVPITELGPDADAAEHHATDRRATVPIPAMSAAPTSVPAGPTSLRAAADDARAAFDAAIAAGSPLDAAAAILNLERSGHDWAADTLQSADLDHARRELRGMVLDLAARAADGLTDPRERLSPLVELILEHRQAARRDRDFGTADRLRERLAAYGVEVRDTAVGSDWTLRDG